MKFLSEKMTRSIGRKVLTTKKQSPHIFFALGVAGIVTSAVLACRSTLKLEKAVDEIKNDFESVKMLKVDFEREKNLTDRKVEVYSDHEYYRDLGYVYGKSGAKLVRLYGLPVVIGTVSIGLLTGSHIQMNRRNAALTAAFSAISQAYDEYRERVRDAVGVDRERDIYHDVQSREVETADGKKEIVRATMGTGLSPYSVIFDSECINFEPSLEMNRFFLQCQEKYANQLLTARGHVFLNDVYDSLGFDRTSAGAVVGWVREGEGDGYIDFGMFDAYNLRYLDHYESCFILDFNVDGVIYDKI